MPHAIIKSVEKLKKNENYRYLDELSVFKRDLKNKIGVDDPVDNSNSHFDGTTVKLNWR
jgi:DNA-directed RNA polymerase subunit H (RpoH/RPB5)